MAVKPRRLYLAASVFALPPGMHPAIALLLFAQLPSEPKARKKPLQEGHSAAHPTVASKDVPGCSLQSIYLARIPSCSPSYST